MAAKVRSTCCCGGGNSAPVGIRARRASLIWRGVRCACVLSFSPGCWRDFWSRPCSAPVGSGRSLRPSPRRSRSGRCCSCSPIRWSSPGSRARLERPVVEQPAAERKSVETEVATFVRGWARGVEGPGRDLGGGGARPAARAGRCPGTRVRRSGIGRMAAGAAPDGSFRRLRLWLPVGLLACYRVASGADHGLAAGHARRARPGGAGTPALRPLLGADLRAGQHRRLSRLRLAGEPAGCRAGLSAGLPGATGGARARALPVRAAAPALPGRADE